MSETIKESWSISIYSGETPLDLAPFHGSRSSLITRHDVTDIAASFVADPFMIRSKNTWYLFMEIMDATKGKGVIGLTTSSDGIHWNYQKVVLEEDFHLSYPFVFESHGSYYMVPETLDANAIRLYKTSNFPYDWEFAAELLPGQYADPTLLQYENKWWMFAASSPYQSDTLNLFYADQLHGPYIEHPQSPIINGDHRNARPAGRILRYNDLIYRICQDCYPKYGSNVRAFRIDTLTPSEYTETEHPKSPILTKADIGAQWNSRGMHHLDAHQIKDNEWLACVDGCYSETEIIKKRAVWIFDETFKTAAFLSVASFRAHLNIPITLLYYGNPNPEIVDAFQKIGGDLQIILQVYPDYSGKNRTDRHVINRLARMKVMRNWPEEQVILLDGDLIFSEEIKQLETIIDRGFENINKNSSIVMGVTEYDLKFYTLQRDQNGNRNNTTQDELHQCLFDVQGKNWKERLSGLQYNNGLLVMYNCADLADAWEANYREGLTNALVNPEDDQLPLCGAMYDLNTQTLEIDPAFNSLGKVSGDYIVYHAWMSRWKIELEKILAGRKDFADYGRIAQQYYQKMPPQWLVNY